MLVIIHTSDKLTISISKLVSKLIYLVWLKLLIFHEDSNLNIDFISIPNFYGVIRCLSLLNVTFVLRKIFSSKNLVGFSVFQERNHF